METPHEQSNTIVDALIDEEGCVHVWCTHCGCYHHHGRGEGQRVAHCIVDGSPYARTGYYLRVAGYWTDEHRKQAGAWEQAAWRRQVRAELQRMGLRP
jgi:hypothetical protein